MLAALAGKDWGWRAVSLRRVFQATISSVLNYCGPAWQPFMSPTSTDILQRAQNRALRSVTACLSTTPVETLHIETSVPLMATQVARNSAVALEKSLRLPTNHTRHQIAAAEVHHRKKRGSWRQTSSRLVEQIGLNEWPRANFAPPSEAPWIDTMKLWEVEISPEAKNSRRLSPTSRTQAGEAIMSRHLTGAKWIIFTDGAAHRQIGSGSAIIVYPNTTPSVNSTHPLPQDNVDEIPNDPTNQSPISSLVASQERVIISRSNAANTQAYDAEVLAVSMAANWLSSEGGSDPAVIACDNAGLLAAIQRPSIHSTDLIELNECLTACRRLITLVWIPSGSPGNKEADEAARAARGILSGQVATLSYPAAKAVINSEITDPRPSNLGVLTHYAPILNNPHSSKRNIIYTKIEAASSRAEEVLLRQIRSGHCHKFAAFRAVMDPSVDPTCLRCNDGLETNLHWLLDCRAIAEQRRIAFGDVEPDVAALVDRPVAGSSLARLTLC